MGSRPTHVSPEADELPAERRGRTEIGLAAKVERIHRTSSVSGTSVPRSPPWSDAGAVRSPPDHPIHGNTRDCERHGSLTLSLVLALVDPRMSRASRPPVPQTHERPAGGRVRRDPG